jgi:hypothetical protein
MSKATSNATVMSTQEIRTKWNSLTPAQRQNEFGASKASSKRPWDSLTVMQQMLIAVVL